MRHVRGDKSLVGPLRENVELLYRCLELDRILGHKSPKVGWVSNFRGSVQMRGLLLESNSKILRHALGWHPQLNCTNPDSPMGPTLLLAQ